MARMLTQVLQLLVLSRENLDLTSSLPNCSVGGSGSSKLNTYEYELRLELCLGEDGVTIS